jgi:hypothetical protein
MPEENDWQLDGLAVPIEPLPICSWASFFYYWKKNFPKLVIPQARRDICDTCFIAANSFRFNQNKTCTVHTNNIVDEPTNNDRSTFDGEFCDATNENVNHNEKNISDASEHVDSARKMRELVNQTVNDAKFDGFNDIPRESRKYCLVGDYCQNMSAPHFGSEQPGATYYFSPLNVYCFGMVDVAAGPDLKMYAHIYHEGEGKKGGNNVASLIIKTLKIMGLAPSPETGISSYLPTGKLSVIMDNCAGQNKNRMVLRLALYLVEASYFREVEFIFLVAGHTKNQCDRMFNKLKKKYNKSNVYSMQVLEEVLKDENIDVQRVKDGDFADWDSFLNNLYCAMPVGMTFKNHIFSVAKSLDGEMTMQIKTCAGEESSIHSMTKSLNISERSELLKTNVPNVLQFPGLRPIKQAELYNNFRRFIPAEYQDEMCPKPTVEVLVGEKKERSDRAKSKRDLKRKSSI